MSTKARAKPAKGRRLKVFRTAIGFHDAYVAAPSRKAALAAWGTDKDLFARGVAEEVVDETLTAEPLAEPGTVFRRLRSSPEEEPGPPAKPRRPRAARQTPIKTSGPRPTRQPPPPRPDSADLERAREAVAQARARHEAEQSDLAARERALTAERRATEARQGKEQRLLQRKLDAAEQDQEVRMADWREALGRHPQGDD